MEHLQILYHPTSLVLPHSSDTLTLKLPIFLKIFNRQIVKVWNHHIGWLHIYRQVVTVLNHIGWLHPCHQVVTVLNHIRMAVYLSPRCYHFPWLYQLVQYRLTINKKRINNMYKYNNFSKYIHFFTCSYKIFWADNNGGGIHKVLIWYDTHVLL